MFYNNKSSRELDIYGGDLLVIPSQFFKVVNDAKSDLQDADFHTLLAAMVESGLTKAINDGEKGKNNFPNDNSVIMDSQGPGDRDYINLCLHLWPNVSVHWMHMHIYQDQAWNNADLLWNNANTCTRIQKPDGGWDSLLEDKDAFIQKVNHLADLLECNMGDGQTGNVQNFDKDSCPGSDAVNDTASDDVASDISSNVTSSDQASCPVANPNSDSMTDSFKAQWEQTKDHLDDLTHDNRGAQVFRQYVETCEVDGNTATSSNELDMQIAQDIGGTTMFYNNKSSREHLDIYGGDLLVIPSQFFKVVNDAKSDLQDADFHTLLAAMVESGLTKAINDGEKGKNNFPNDNSVLMDSQGPGDRDYINM